MAPATDRYAKAAEQWVDRTYGHIPNPGVWERWAVKLAEDYSERDDRGSIEDFLKLLEAEHERLIVEEGANPPGA
jgi:hypothetical protein